MRGIFLAAALLISAPVYADQAREFSEFLEEYKAFSEKRNLQNQRPHGARFQGSLTFREGCSGTFYADDVCECPPGNNYLQCLVSAQAVIGVDPNDVGGRGYVLITAGMSALNSKGQWVSSNERNVYSSIIEPLSSTHIVKIPTPPRSVIDSFCAGNGGNPLQISVGYGAAMPMEIEFARRMKERSVSFGHGYDEQGFLLSQARINGMRPNKGAVIGSAACRQTAD